MSRTTRIAAVACTSAAAFAITVPAATAAPAHPSPAAAAQAAIRHAPGQVVLDAHDTLRVRDVVVDPDGTAHVRFDRFRFGLPVVGGDLVVHQAHNGRLLGVSATTRRTLALSTTPAVAASDASSAALAADHNRPTGAAPARLEIDARSATPRLVWSVDVHGTQPDGTPSELLTLVDARTGSVVEHHEQVETDNSTGSGTGVFDGTVPLNTTTTSSTTTDSSGTPTTTTTYTLTDNTRGGQHTNDMNGSTTGNGTLFTSTTNGDVWGDATAAPREQAAVDAQYGAARTLDYYRDRFSRNGINGAGGTGFNRVHYGSAYNNAFWDNTCFCMTYGDGDGATYQAFTELDVTGHEMSHGVTAATANLTYSRESGGLNEATSDIFGTMVEWATNNPNDTPDYLIGEKLRPGGAPLRYMDKPSKDGKSADCWSRKVGNLDVHYSSGVANHLFYLLSEGSGAKSINGLAYNSPACNGKVVTGMGNNAAAAIWYRALTVYMTSSTDYSGARAATLKAATDLAGKPVQGTLDTVPAGANSLVAAAWAGVGVTR